MEAFGNALGDSLGTPLGGLGHALGCLGDALEGLGSALGSFGDALEGFGNALENLLGRTLEKPRKNLPERPPRIHVVRENSECA